MDESKGRESDRQEKPEDTPPGTGEPGAEGGEATGPIPDLVRKALAMGLAGFFSTEQTVRKALGDTLPKEWIDFMTDQSERTRSDLTEAIASEVGRTLKTIDLTQVADQLLSGRTLEVSARIRLLPVDETEDEGK